MTSNIIFRDKKKKILLIIPNLAAGGAEKVMSFLAQNLNKNQFSAKLLVIGFEKDTAYDVSKVETIYLNHAHVSKAFIAILKFIHLEKPDLVLSSLSHLNATMGYISFLVPRTIFIGRETIVQSAQEVFSGSQGLKSKLTGYVYNFGYRGLKKLISQSQDMKNDLVEKQGFKNEKIITINNPVSDNFTIKSAIPSTLKKYEFITVGRLTKKKGHERILRILSKINLPFNYTILGDGHEKPNILSLATKLNISDKITYVPFTKEVNKYLSNSHVYLQGSYVEGFPNALIESLSVGTPAVVFNAPGGMNEIMIDGVNGYLADNEKLFLSNLERLITNIDHFTPMQVSRDVRKKYSANNIISKYEALFNSLIENKN
tara:strand:+ start:26094 stop:27212 length:1119 start_codon:yes stop_codon:yes gene_type:complete